MAWCRQATTHYLSQCLPRSLYNYADDNTLSNTHHSITCLKTKLETSAAVAMHWFDVNGMKSNQAKFQAMILNNHPDLSDISLCVNDMNIPLKSCVKLLGVFIHHEPNFSDHVTYLCKRTSRQLNAVRRIAKYLKKDCLMKIFYAFVISNFSYCATVWHFCSKSSTIKMEKKCRKLLCEWCLMITLPTIANFWVCLNGLHCSLYDLGHCWLRFSSVSEN